ncbi:MAG: hypothetical protein D6B28_09350 [Gammaproteobacteria bacterium]|nr:MAG: hypothetical protein D6B28_09350 [Gammaproteobacteria bacterium]
MGISTLVSDDKKKLTFQVSGNMDFSIVRPLFGTANDYASDETTFIINFDKQTNVHDSGLGAILHLAEIKHESIRLENCPKEVSAKIENSSLKELVYIA